MSLFTSSQFAACAASGTDWRDAAKTILKQLEKTQNEGHKFNVGFLYISDALVGDAISILNLFKSVLKIENWVGTIGIGVCGIDNIFIDQPAIAAMIGQFEDSEFCLFPALEPDTGETEKILAPWLKNHDPMLVLAHGDPMAEEDPAKILKNLENITGGFIIGGLSSSRTDHLQFAGDHYNNGICGIAFSDAVPVATTLSQGCQPLAGVRVITRGDGHVIREIDGQKAQSIFEQDLRTMAIKTLDRDPDTIILDEDVLTNPEAIPDEFKSVFKGEVSIAFPISESDQNDYLVRNIIGIDEDGGIMVSSDIMNGESVMFVRRDSDTVREDLSRQLIKLRQRVTKDTGQFSPKGGIYVSCVARALSKNNQPAYNEIDLIREIIGDIPLAGFYAGGEISNAKLYGYTGILTLFL